MLDALPIEPRTTRYGCGIYEVATERDDVYVRLFVTDSGWVKSLNGPLNREEDLMDVYVVGRVDGEKSITAERALAYLADNCMESGREIGKAVERLRNDAERRVD